MTNQKVVNFLNQVRKILLDDKSWLESTVQRINEAFDLAISALEKQDVPDTNVGDTISRQAAVDAFEDTTYTKNEIRRRITELPPAQPEIITCRNCEYYKLGSDGVGYCFKHDDDILWQDDDFCSYAERRTDDVNADA